MHALPVRNVWFPVLLIVCGAAMLLARLHVAWFGWPEAIWLVVMVAGGIKLYNAFVLKSRGGAFWGLFWCVLGGAFLLRSYRVLWLDPGVVVAGLFIVSGAGLALMYLVSRRDWYLLVPAACLLFVGFAILSTELGYLPEWEVAPFVNRWWPAGFVLCGAALVLNAVLPRRPQGENGATPPA